MFKLERADPAPFAHIRGLSAQIHICEIKAKQGGLSAPLATFARGVFAGHFWKRTQMHAIAALGREREFLFPRPGIKETTPTSGPFSKWVRVQGSIGRNVCVRERPIFLRTHTHKPIPSII